MAVTSPNMSLVRWTAVNDRFNHTELAENFRKIDEHDHTGAPGRGTQIPTAGIANLAITTAKLADLNVTSGKIADLGVTTGKLNNRAVTAPKVGVLPHARAFHNVNQAVADITATTLAFNSERFDTDTIHDTVTNNGRLTCKTAGLYMITVNLRWGVNSTGYRRAAIVLNGTTSIAFARQNAVPGIETEQNLSTFYQLNVNDYLTVEVFQNSGAAVDIVAASAYSPEFGMTFLSNF